MNTIERLATLSVACPMGGEHSGGTSGERIKYGQSC